MNFIKITEPVNTAQITLNTFCRAVVIVCGLASKRRFLCMFIEYNYRVLLLDRIVIISCNTHTVTLKEATSSELATSYVFATCFYSSTGELKKFYA